MTITSGWAFALMAGVFVAVACGSPDAHINSAVTLGSAVSTRSFVKLTPYIVAQILCALSGATLVWLHFPPHRMLTEDAGLKLACFRNFASNLSSEIVGTLALVFVVGAIFQGTCWRCVRLTCRIRHSSRESVFHLANRPATQSIRLVHPRCPSPEVEV
jgi:glycerol uptake facilitator-like aquaporin